MKGWFGSGEVGDVEGTVLLDAIGSAIRADE
jgi:hypothetical protein